jgi:excisionase family DNA binding protein
MTPRLLPPASAAKYLGVEKSTFYVTLPTMGLRPVRMGKRDLYDIRDLDAWVDRQKEVARA